MKISSIKLKNFRSYKDEVEIKFNDFTALIGKNDAGKSTVLEALDIFFNDAKIDKDDINIENGENTEIIISVCFTDLPNSIVIDENVSTTLQDEYLLNENQELEIIKKYSNAGKPKVFIRAMHPTNENCRELLTKKQKDLQKIIQDNQIDSNDIDLRKNSEMRKKIWQYFSDNLEPQIVEIELNKEDAKNIWDKLQKDLPTYFLFKSDRENNDKDSEVQDPLKTAVKEFLENNAEIKSQLNDIARQVDECISQVSARTLAKLRELDESIANTLHPQINVEGLKWQDVFKGISIAGDDDIPINKRGSGVKRLILLSFFRAKAEQAVSDNANVIYAIEEPETSQHTKNQIILINSLKELSRNTQILITTHSSVVVKSLQFDNLRIVVDNGTGKSIKNVQQALSTYKLLTNSLNEINYLVFDDVSEAYHDELYSELIDKGLWNTFDNSQSKQKYIKENKDKTTKEEQKSLTEIIRHQIHHPENKHNPKYTQEQLKNSIELMRNFLINNRQNNSIT